ncbi:PmoA family protein [Prolixibacteraceae bacterium Z1-6]|uniref:PmoA family protein n=1 Tax=Draconibacterium aestuarii TaxID=2998507 RepID=A0A9X3J701_9BACT|nr:PmoA family protein [Prolixibacteraceae bacterium Z1-6]
MYTRTIIFFAFAFCGLLMFSGCGDDKQQVEINVNNGSKKVDVLIDGSLLTSYIFPETIMKPTLWPIMSSAGNMVTRSFPLADKAGDRVDHPHHVGAWLNYGDVNGLDFWNNSEAIPESKRHQYGTIYHRSVDKAESGNGNGVLVTTSDWKSVDKQTLLEEKTRFEFIAVSPEVRIIDRTTTLKSVVEEVKFTDNKEGVFAIRVARELELPSEKPTELVDSHGVVTKVNKMDNSNITGNYRSAEGIEGEDVWATRSRWMKLSGKINGENISLIIIDNPSNVGYPTYWHARGYGLFSSNTLGHKVFSDGKEELNLTLKKGESTTFKYRMVITSNEITDKEINLLANEFARK